MNKKLPYEEELSRQLNDLPLPDEDVSWQDMNRRLDEDKDDGIIVPPILKGCAGYGLLLLVLGFAAWLIIKPGKWPWNKNEKEMASPIKAHAKKIDTIAVDSNGKESQETFRQPGVVDSPPKYPGSVAGNTQQYQTKDSLKENNTSKKNPQQEIPDRGGASINDDVKPGNASGKKAFPKKITGRYTIKNKHLQKQNKKTDGRLMSKITGNQQSEDSLKDDNENIKLAEDSMIVKDNINIDSALKKTIDSNITNKKIKDIDHKDKAIKKDSVTKLFYFAAGAALHQQLPVNGQKLVPYNSLGRKSTLGDYIPSVYLRFYKDKKWFLQAEFRYGAPQYTKDILYAQKKLIDTFTRITLDTSNRLKKTYYHQLPVSFNYFVLPHFSIGAGVIWNKFSSAVSEQEVKLTDNITLVDTFLTKTIFRPKNTDSNFVKSYFQALIETQYQWKRWSLGARYSFGLEPYIKFQLPGGQQRDEKNSSLSLFLRYNFWESRKK